MGNDELEPDAHTLPEWYSSLGVLLIFGGSFACGIWAWAATGSHQLPLVAVLLAMFGAGLVGCAGVLIVLCAVAPVVAYLNRNS